MGSLGSAKYFSLGTVYYISIAYGSANRRVWDCYQEQQQQTLPLTRLPSSVIEPPANCSQYLTFTTCFSFINNSGITDYVVSGSAAKRTSSKSSSAQKNLKKKRATSEFWRSDYGFTGFELEANKIKVSYINKDDTQVYTFTKENPRKSSSSVIG